jgi:hypothetical protein
MYNYVHLAPSQLDASKLIVFGTDDAACFVVDLTNTEGQGSQSTIYCN